jgi:tetratricopeptide (TPR) repeat protein
MTTSRNLRVFLWHSPADKLAIQDLYKQLTSENWIEPWLEEENLLPGQVREAEIDKAIRAADVVIVGLSKGSVTTEGPIQRQLNAVLDVAEEKREGSIFIIPLRLDECELPERLKRLQSIDYFPKKQRWQTGEKLLQSFRVRAKEIGIFLEQESAIPDVTIPSRSFEKKQHSIKSPKYEIGPVKPVVSPAEFPIRVIPFQENKNFCGRKAILEAIHSEFTEATNSIAVHAVTGLGGIGKTQIAVQYSRRYGEEYDLVWWIRSETDASLTSDYQALSNALQLPVKMAAEQAVYVNLINNWLENTEHKWLLVFDNVEAQEKVEKHFPKKGHGHILITSQNPDWREIAQDSHVKPFTPEEIREYCEKRLKLKDMAVADKLGALLGGLPLAMEQASAYMSRRGTPVEIYIQLFEAQQKELWQHETPPKNYRATVTTTWEMAFKQIQQTQPVAKDLLNLFSFFAPDAIPLSIIKTFVSELPPSAREVVIQPLALEDCLAALNSYSLIEREGDVISIHRLVQDVVRSNLPPEKLEKWLGLAVKIMEKAFPYDEYDIKTWPPCSRLLPHALSAAGYAEKYSIGLELASDIYQKVGEYLRQLGEYPKAGDTIQHAIDLRQELSGIKPEKLAQSLDYLGETRSEQARYDDAFKLHQQSLQILESQPDSHAQINSRNLNNLGYLYYQRGDFENARNYYEKSLTIRRIVLGEKHPATGNSLNNIAGLLKAQGDFENARKLYEEDLAICRTALGENHPRTATSLNNIGALLGNQGDFESARKLNEEALAIYRSVLGENHPDTAKCLNNIGIILQDQGDFENAKIYYEKALLVKRTILGENHPNTAVSLNNIGTLLSQQSNHTEARPYLEQALSINEKLFGTKHHTLVAILSNLAKVMFYLRQYPQARQYAARAARICTEAKEKYEECEEIKQLQKLIPIIGKNKHQ